MHQTLIVLLLSLTCRICNFQVTREEIVLSVFFPSFYKRSWCKFRFKRVTGADTTESNLCPRNRLRSQTQFTWNIYKPFFLLLRVQGGLEASSSPFRLDNSLVRTSQETHYLSFTTTNRLMLFREMITLYWYINAERINTSCGKNAELSHQRPIVSILTDVKGATSDNKHIIMKQAQTPSISFQSTDFQLSNSQPITTYHSQVNQLEQPDSS
jgi:hypothetical protein